MDTPDRTPKLLVVGVAVLRDGRVLAARRRTPREAAGRWELPGGKAWPEEQPEATAVREVAEELGCGVSVIGWLTGEQALPGGLRLRVATAELVDGEPRPGEHDAVWWLGADELDRVDWLEPDLPFVRQLQGALRPGPAHQPAPDRAPGGGPTTRVVLPGAEEAHEVAERLRAAGFGATVAREPFAGEDDEADQPWAVGTDAPAFVVEVLADEYDAWVEDVGAPRPASPGPTPPPLPLPQSPRRVKGHSREP